MQELLQTKTYSFSKIDFGILITSSIILGLQLFDMTSWYSDFEHILVCNLAPLIVGSLGVIYSFMQNKDTPGKVILGLICILDVIFSIWWIVLQFEIMNIYSSGYQKFIHVVFIIVYGSMYVGPFILSGLQLWNIQNQVDTPQEVSVNLMNLLSIISVSIMIMFNQTIMFQFTLFGEFGFAFDEWYCVLMAILALVGYPLVIAGLFGTIKNHLQAMYIYGLGQLIIWTFYFIFIAIIFGSKYDVYHGIYISIMAFLLLSISSYKTYLLKNNPEQDRPEYNSIV